MLISLSSRRTSAKQTFGLREPYSAAIMMRQQLATALRQRQLLNYKFSQGFPAFGTTAVRHAKSPRHTVCPRFALNSCALRRERAQGKPDASRIRWPCVRCLVESTQASFTTGLADIRLSLQEESATYAMPPRPIVSGPHSLSDRDAPLEDRNANDITLNENKSQAKNCDKRNRRVPAATKCGSDQSCDDCARLRSGRISRLTTRSSKSGLCPMALVNTLH
jgi:hypothetical protein